MRNIFRLSMILILMVSFTGISSTTDLTENSIVICSVDNDVGAKQISTVENNYVSSIVLSNQLFVALETKVQSLEVPWCLQETIKHNFYYLDDLEEVTFDIDQPPIKKTARKKRHKNRLPRGAL